MPDHYDRSLGSLHDLPDVIRTSPSITQTIPLMGVGGARTFIVRTFRQSERGDTIFLEMTGAGEHVRLVIPPQVANVIARQRDALTAKSRSRHGKEVAQSLKERGIKPGFMLKKKEAGR
jgi:hypothetical protein